MADELNTVLRNKKLFKLCEAVALGLKRYYMGPNDRRELTVADYKESALLLPKLPKGWMQSGDKMPWSCLNKK